MECLFKEVDIQLRICMQLFQFKCKLDREVFRLSDMHTKCCNKTEWRQARAVDLMVCLILNSYPAREHWRSPFLELQPQTTHFLDFMQSRGKFQVPWNDRIKVIVSVRSSRILQLWHIANFCLPVSANSQIHNKMYTVFCNTLRVWSRSSCKIVFCFLMVFHFSCFTYFFLHFSAVLTPKI